jgi:hypothetical protein
MAVPFVIERWRIVWQHFGPEVRQDRESISLAVSAMRRELTEFAAANPGAGEAQPNHIIAPASGLPQSLCPVRLRDAHGQPLARPLVLNQEVAPLPPATFEAVEALVGAFPDGVSDTDLTERLGGDPARLLRELHKRHPDSWGLVITWTAGRKGAPAVYRLRRPEQTQPPASPSIPRK